MLWSLPDNAARFTTLMAFGPASSSAQASASHIFLKQHTSCNLLTVAEMNLTRDDIALLWALLQAVTLPEELCGGGDAAWESQSHTFDRRGR